MPLFTENDMAALGAAAEDMKISHRDLILWVTERLENCMSFSRHSDGKRREAWIEDAIYFRAILRNLEAQLPSRKTTDAQTAE